MGVLLDQRTDRRHTLPNRLLVGRGRACALRLEGALVSGEHAVVEWRDAAWHVRDLASRNGTFVRGERIEAGAWTSLERGDPVAFGEPASPWTLIDDSSPGVMAVCLSDGRQILAHSSVLALPDEDSATAIVRREGSGWVTDLGHEVHPVADQQVLTVDGEAFRIHVPMALPATRNRLGTVALADVLVRIGVTRNQEHTQVSVVAPDATTGIRPRSYHYLLAVLARARQADATAIESEQGWQDAEHLSSRLRIPKRTMDVQICRIRAQFRDLDLVGAEHVIERRGSMVRLGISRFEVVDLD